MRSEHQRHSILLVLTLVVLGLIAGLHCDSVLPEKLKEKQFTISAKDEQACGVLTSADTNLTVLTRTAASLVDSATRATATENQMVLAAYNRLADSAGTLQRDRLNYVRYPAGQAISYATLKVAATGDVCIYSSLTFNSANVGERVSIGIVKSDTSYVGIADNMDLSSVSGCVQTVNVNQDNVIVPVIRLRLQAHLDVGTYLVRFTVSAPSAVGPVRVLIVSQ